MHSFFIFVRLKNLLLQPSVSSTGKRAQLPDDADREVANTYRRSSRSKSPLNQPRATTSEDPCKAPTNVEPTRAQSVSSNDQKEEEQKQTFEPPAAIVSPTSRQGSAKKTEKQTFEPPATIVSPRSRQSSADKTEQQTFEPSATTVSPRSRQGSAKKTEQQPPSRPPTTKKSEENDNFFETSTDISDSEHVITDEQSKLIKPGEQLEIPADNMDNKRLNSPPPSLSTTGQLVSANPLLENDRPEANPEESRPASQISRKSPITSSVSNEKLIDGDAVSAKSRASSNTSQQRTKIPEAKVTPAGSRKGSAASVKDRKSTKDSRRSSADADIPVPTSKETDVPTATSKDAAVPIPTSGKQEKEHVASSDKPKSPLPKRSPQQSRTNSSNTTDRTAVTPIKINSAKSQQQNEKVKPYNFVIIIYVSLFSSVHRQQTQRPSV